MPDAEIFWKLADELYRRFAPVVWLAAIAPVIALTTRVSSRLGAALPTFERLSRASWSLPILLWALCSIVGLILLFDSPRALFDPRSMQQQLFVSLYALVLAVAATAAILCCHEGAAGVRRLRSWLITLTVGDTLILQVLIFVMWFRLPRGS